MMNTESVRADAADISTRPVLELHDVRKAFGGTKALNGVSLSIEPGEVHGLIGENGAGKSTLIKVLCGIVRPDEGAINLSGRAYAPTTPREAKANGLQVVHQEFNLLPYLSVAENIFIEHLPRNALGVVRLQEMHAGARAALDAIGLSDIDVRWPVERLGIAHRQLVEVARALMTESRILILDEPTATLTSRETERLFKIINELRSRGVSIIFVSHHLDEVFRICDRVTVLRNGETVFSRPIAETNQDELVRAMVGRKLQQQMASEMVSLARPEEALSLVNFRHPQSPHAQGISLQLHKGEILGIAGLVGSGRTELLRAIAAAEPPLSGALRLEGAPVSFRSPREAINAGIGFVTEDRKEEGLILNMPIAANVTLASLSDVSSAGILDRKAEIAVTERLGAEAQAEIWRAGQKCRDAFRRQPAEGGARQVAGAQSESAFARRTDARRRRRREG